MIRHVVQAKKKIYQVWAEVLYRGSTPRKVYSWLEDGEDIAGEKDCAIVTGTASQQYVVPFDRFCKTYTTMEGTPLDSAVLYNMMCKEASRLGIPANKLNRVPGQPYLTSKDAPQVYAYRVPKDQTMQVRTSWGALLQVNAPGMEHGEGDWVLIAMKDDGTPDFKDQWVVNGLVFRDTYNTFPTDKPEYREIDLP